MYIQGVSLEHLKDLYDAGLLTRGELYARITELLPVDIQKIRRIFGAEPQLVTGLVDWLQAVADGASIFGGEQGPASPSEPSRREAARALAEAGVTLTQDARSIRQ